MYIRYIRNSFLFDNPLSQLYIYILSTLLYFAWNLMQISPAWQMANGTGTLKSSANF